MKIADRIRENAKEIGQHRPIVIGFLGDSITQGCFEIYRTGEASLETEFRSYEAYHQKLKKILEEVFPNVPVIIINAGISGNTANAGKERIERDILSFSPDIVVVCFGLNDVNRGIKGVGEYEKALESIFCELRNRNVETIFMTPNMMGTRAVAEEKDPYIYSVLETVTSLQREGVMDIYMAKAKQVCEKYHIPVCDCYGKWKKLEENGADVTRLLANRVNHPTEQMHWLFAYSLFEMMMGFCK